MSKMVTMNKKSSVSKKNNKIGLLGESFVKAIFSDYSVTDPKLNKACKLGGDWVIEKNGKKLYIEVKTKSTIKFNGYWCFNSHNIKNTHVNYVIFVLKTKAGCEINLVCSKHALSILFTKKNRSRYQIKATDIIKVADSTIDHIKGILN